MNFKFYIWVLYKGEYTKSVYWFSLYSPLYITVVRAVNCDVKSQEIKLCFSTSLFCFVAAHSSRGAVLIWGELKESIYTNILIHRKGACFILVAIYTLRSKTKKARFFISTSLFRGFLKSIYNGIYKYMLYWKLHPAFVKLSVKLIS